MSVTNPLTRLPMLRPVPIFRGLPKSTLLEVARRAAEVAVPAGALIVTQGEPGDSLSIIVSGTVEVRRDDRPVARMTAGDYFGEISLIDGKPRSATVVAVDEVVLLTITATTFDSLLSIPYVARAALTGLAERVREAHASHDRQPI
jgi:CRP-like cAMP-binding protein